MKAHDLLVKFHSLFTDKVDLNMATPIFIDGIGQDDEKNKRDLEKLSKKYSSANFLNDDIERFEG